MAVFGTVDSFDIKCEHFDEYLERVEQYFIANGIDDDKKKTVIFITAIGKETYGVLRSLLAPAKPSTKTYKKVTEVLTNHLQPKPIIIAE